jgi:MFS family permease
MPLSTWLYMDLLGQILGGIGQPFFYCTASKLANTWFGAQERTLAITVLLVTLNIGTLLGSYLPQYFVNINADNITILDQVAHMLLVFALIGTLFFVLVVLFMREKPLTPPSKAAAAPKHNFLDSLKTLVKDRNPMMVIISAAMIFSSVNAYCGCLQQIAQNFNINGDQVGDILSIASLGSIIGAIAITSVFNRYKRYNLFLRILCISSLVIMVGNIFATESGNIYLFAATIILYTSTTAPVLPISVDYSADLSFPVAEFTSTGLLYVIFSVTATVESLIADQIVSDDPTASGRRWAIIMTVICQVVGTLPLFWVKENLKRTKYEQEETLDPASGSTV